MSSENWITCARQKVGVTGLEPVTPTMSTSYSNQLSYTPPSVQKVQADSGLELPKVYSLSLQTPEFTVEFAFFAGKQGV